MRSCFKFYTAKISLPKISRKLDKGDFCLNLINTAFLMFYLKRLKQNLYYVDRTLAGK